MYTPPSSGSIRQKCIAWWLQVFAGRNKSRNGEMRNGKQEMRNTILVHEVSGDCCNLLDAGTGHWQPVLSGNRLRSLH